MERFARENLEAFEINLMATEELKVFFGEILTDDADQLHGSKETGRDGGMAGRAAEEPGIFGLGSFNGVQGGGTDNQYAHVVLNWLFWLQIKLGTLRSFGKDDKSGLPIRNAKLKISNAEGFNHS
jgi:hypothetical protein